MNNELEKYARAVVGIGVNIQPGQKLVIYSDVNAAYFARAAMEEAYRRGAADVYISYSDEGCDRIHYLLAPEENFGKTIAWEKTRMQHLLDEKYHLLAIESDDPENLKGVCPDRIEKDEKVYNKMYKPRSDQITENGVQWSMCAVPSIAWAKKVFPDAKSDEDAIKMMWDAIFAACRIDEGDPEENWKKHTENLHKKANILNDFNFDNLHFTNSLGTNLEVKLPKNHRWIACGERAKTGVNFVANMPTEEVFTAPQRDGVNGKVFSTKPLIYMGDTIENFWLLFKDGKVVEFDAEKNRNLLEKLLTSDEGASFLGEVALVPHSSPISQSGILWYNSLYDENASCHLALGEGYPDCIAGAVGKSDDEQAAMGLNQSLEHEDFMIGSQDLDIIGTTQNGEKIQIFKGGEWAL